ncbi:hypothetical protein HIC20_02645 [Buchnera aphidicola (Hormaphis cornu)]|nr:hypothetical protein HIC20_02645 [Buchnera aphidicola (Hormaphis cornu)]
MKNSMISKYNSNILVFGLVILIKLVLTKNKERIVILTIDDKSSRMEVLIFPDLYKKNANLIAKDKILIIKGRLIYDKFTNIVRLIAHYIVDLETQRIKILNRIIINIASHTINKKFFSDLEQLLEKFKKGTIPIFIFYKRSQVSSMFRLGDEWKIFPSNELLLELKSLVKPEQVILKFKKNNRNVF